MSLQSEAIPTAEVTELLGDILPPAAGGQGGQYTDTDRAKVAQVAAWLKTNDKSRAWLSKKSGIPSGTISQVLSCKYVSSPTRQLDTMLAVIAVEAERMLDGAPGYVKGSVHRLMEVVCDRTRKHGNFGVVTGNVGIGKTRFAQEYRASHPMTLLVEVSPNMTPGVLLTELLTQLNVAVPGGLDRKFREIVRVLRGTTHLLIADEAERLSPSALEYLRRIRDLALVGVVLTGTEKLTTLIRHQHGQFDQVRSRVGMWPKTIERITRDDADDIARARLADALPAGAEVPDEVLDALWAYGDGSARMLTENILPALRDYGVGRMPLTAPLVDKIVQTVLFMQPRRAH